MQNGSLLLGHYGIAGKPQFFLDDVQEEEDLHKGAPITGFLVEYVSPMRERYLLGASEVSANLYCNSRTSVFGRLRDFCGYLWGTR